MNFYLRGDSHFASWSPCFRMISNMAAEYMLRCQRLADTQLEKYLVLPKTYWSKFLFSFPFT